MESWLKELLEVLDSLDRGISAADPSGPSVLRDGLVKIRNQFLSILSRHGVQPMALTGTPYDPHLAEAVATVQDGSLPVNTLRPILPIAPLFFVVACGPPERPSIAEESGAQTAASVSEPPVSETDTSGSRKGPCTEEGRIVRCKILFPQSDSDVANCFVGEQVCADGEWSPCQDPAVISSPTE